MGADSLAVLGPSEKSGYDRGFNRKLKSGARSSHVELLHVLHEKTVCIILFRVS